MTPEQRQIVSDTIGSGGSVAAAARAAGVDWHSANRVAGRRPGDRPASEFGDLGGLAAELLSLIEGRRQSPAPESAPEPAAAPPDEPSRPAVVHAAKPYSRVLWLSDVHVPYHDRRALDIVLGYAGDWKPDLVIVGGDLYDCYGISRYEKDPERLGDTLQAEFDAARPITAALDALGSDVVYILGNHEARLQAIVGANPALSGLRALGWRKMAELPERWRVLPDQTRYRLGGLDFLHGNLKGRGGGARHIAAWMFQKLKRSCLFGHYHRQQSFIDPDGDGTPRGGFSTGHLLDVSQADYIACPDWVSGFATVDFDHAAEVFSVRQHLIHAGKCRIDGRTYAGC
jgi:predicted phosphodiesterase